ncbi:Cof-type HAD-IIB family hydrolase [Streptomyces fragilis]|uniref:Cof-type HAD-IIB family hydrolase n=1 Tax=Streptomyces fragilis TaxID=67301 RepID=A0ABV2YD69_9ACTN|nr:Cof-type HAD-IIB family hydrolase [Streptomyces fragilis]
MRENGGVTSALEAPATRAHAAVPPRLIATDLDGTLLRDDKSVSPRTVAALAAAEEAGLEVFFVTGRPARWMEVVADHLQGHGLAICGNGAAVVDLHEGPGRHRFAKVREVGHANARETVRLLRETVPGTLFAVEQTYAFHQERAYPRIFVEEPDSYGDAEELLAPGGVTASLPVLKLLAFHHDLEPDAFLGLARTALGERVTVTRSSPSALLEISGPGVSKASTLALCCAERGISPEEVVAFGDMPNDVEMLTWAGRAYAMGNAHPDALRAAGRQTAGNNEDGVALVIEEILATLA